MPPFSYFDFNPVEPRVGLAIVGFALCTEKDWAISAGFVDAVLGTAICLALSIFNPWNESS